ncbi:MAG: tetratricopeptide repeat protein [Bryobacterales bacterium]
MLGAIQSGGFADVEARWLFETVVANPATDLAPGYRVRLIDVQSKRMRHAELGAQLERIWQAHPDRGRQTNILDDAAEAYRKAGDETAELAALERYGGFGRWTERYLELLLARTPDRLIALSADRDRGKARMAADYAVLQGGAALAKRAVEAYGRARPAVWTPSYTGLVGLFHRASESAYAEAFREALGGGTIGERVGQPVNRDQQLAGDVWFEYGARFGEYLAAFEPLAADDYLPSEVENVPGRASAYFALAEIYREHERPEDAAREYEHTLELNAGDARAHERLGGMAWDAGDRTAAVAHWRDALQTLTARAERYNFGARSGTTWRPCWADLGATKCSTICVSRSTASGAPTCVATGSSASRNCCAPGSRTHRTRQGRRGLPSKRRRSRLSRSTTPRSWPMLLGLHVRPRLGHAGGDPAGAGRGGRSRTREFELPAGGARAAAHGAHRLSAGGRPDGRGCRGAR